jgi:bilirubin oxidase
MKTKPLIILTALCGIANAQSPLVIPDTLSGNSILLTLKDTVNQFYTGFPANTISYNESYLGPTLILNKGQSVTINVNNQLLDSTTVHWHGLHIAAMNDGGPHTPIAPSTTWSPSFTVLDNAGTYWYHPHFHMKTFNQVVRGAAGMIIVRDSIESSLTLPRTYGVDDVPLICQFKTFNPTTKQIILSDSMDNVTMVNGVINPYVNSPAQVVRYRILNASSMRVFRFGFSDNRTFYQIASDGGLLNAPVPLTRLTLGVGERAEILVDLSGDLGNTIYLKTFGNELPSGFQGGLIGMMCGQLGPLDNINFNVLQINVVAQTTNPVTTIPLTLTTNTVWSTTGATTRSFTFNAVPMMSCNFFINSTPYDMNINNFTTQQGAVEIWQIQNMTPVAHPFHIHGNHFYIIDRGGNPPPLNEQGRKDVVLIAPMETVKLITKYETFCDPTMPYMYHCHVLKHEDMGMMGQFLVQCSSTGINEIENKTSITIFPNPFSTQTTLQTDKFLKDATLTVYNLYGQEVKQIKNISGQTVTFHRDNLSSGLYFLRITQDSKVIVTDKLVITD